MEQSSEIQFTQEIRFAVVMYGGISLAIYMNGVAQELRKMVAATSPRTDDGRLASHTDAELKDTTEQVYRKLGRMLSWGTAAKEPAEVDDRPDEPIRTRFVIDILSGSSAGGINAVYLAKALANDQPMDELKKLWIEEGDIGLLINDKGSVKGTLLDPQVPSGSLLSGRRMYWKLLDALDGMDNDPRENDRVVSQNVEELDLYITATDMAGQAVKLQLADKVVKEYRHRNVFHFRYGADEHEHDEGGVRNDFLARYNPFLAFAARCTSAHPAAFEPMRLADIDDVLANHPSYAEDPEARADNVRWRRFFKEYLRSRDGNLAKLAETFLNRNFNDGGVLDNRPFGHATDAMPLHRAGVPISRKLVYLDPAPERIREGFKQRSRPNIAENAWVSLSTLPRYEPIREDLLRVLERNRLIGRVNTIVEGMENEDFIYHQTEQERLASIHRQAAYTDEQWDNTKMSEMIEKRGLSWAGYLHLRVTEVTDELALLITRVAGLDNDSDEFRAVRHLVRGWRERRYDPDGEGSRVTEHAFLRRFDVKWRLRRLNYVLAKTDRMLIPEHTRRLVEQATELDLESSDSSFFEALRSLLSPIRRDLDEVQKVLRESRRHLWEARDNHPLRETIGGMNIEIEELKYLLEPQAPWVLEERVDEMVDARQVQLDTFARQVEGYVGEALGIASERCQEILPVPDYSVPIASDASVEEIARRAVRFLYDDFPNYDMISYPILYSTGVGEEVTQIDTFRISPEDAFLLIQDKSDKPKLAGAKLNNFGAFFEKKIRTNDILWGRLDGAERIITALLPYKEDETKREELIEEAHCAIINEEVFGKREEEPPSLSANNPEDSATSDTLHRFKEKYNREYEATRILDPERTVRSAARASRVFGDMLEGYAETQRRLPKGGVVWVTRLAQIFWLLVEVAVPDSLASLMFRHGLKLLYVFEALMILLGTLLLYPTIQQFGFVAFVATATVHAGVLLLQDAMRREQGTEGRWRRVLKYGLAGLILVLAALGLVLVLAALGLQLPRSIVAFMASPPGTAGTAVGMIVRGVIMLAFVGVALLVSRRRIPKRRTDNT
jgi:patatin-related protein